MKRLWQRYPIAVILFVLTSAFALFFATQMIRKTIYWSDPAHQRVTPEGWMTPNYIGRSWHLTRDDMIIILGAPQHGKPRATIAEIAEFKGISTEALIAQMVEKLPQLADQK